MFAFRLPLFCGFDCDQQQQNYLLSVFSKTNPAEAPLRPEDYVGKIGLFLQNPS